MSTSEDFSQQVVVPPRLGLMAGALGSAIAYGALKVVGPSLLGPEFGLHLMPAVAGESVAVAAVIGLVSATISALSATRRAAADSLRSKF